MEDREREREKKQAPTSTSLPQKVMLRLALAPSRISIHDDLPAMTSNVGILLNGGKRNDGLGTHSRHVPSILLVGYDRLSSRDTMFVVLLLLLYYTDSFIYYVPTGISFLIIYHLIFVSSLLHTSNSPTTEPYSYTLRNNNDIKATLANSKSSTIIAPRRSSWSSTVV